MQEASYASMDKVANAPTAEQAVFYRKTYLTAGFSFLAWMIAVFGLFQTGIAYSLLGAMGNVSWLLVLGIFMGASYLGGKLTFAEEKEKQYLGLGIYILAYALIFTPLLSLVVYYSGSLNNAMDNILIPAFIATATIFAALTVTVFMTRTDFSFLRSTVVFGSFIALGAIVIFTLTGAAVGTWFAIGMIVLMSAAILYETHQIKEKFNTNQHIGAGAMLFASFMTLLWYVINLFMRRD
ncbi:MAG: Bax inhibitor-1 family protein [Fibromonadales bacterium]|nr:Bax inhibitor-1 family protein [Fibromonadales bacterium]